MQTKQQALRLGLALSALIAASAVVSADEYVDKAKGYIDQITKPGAAWTGPTSGPKAQGHKSIVFVNYDQRNSGGRAVGEFAAEAAKISDGTTASSMARALCPGRPPRSTRRSP